jgi:uncharacterized membrane protein YhaH (DUF805 family)
MGPAQAMMINPDQMSRFAGRASRAAFWSKQIKSSLVVLGMCLCLLLFIRIVAGPKAIALGPATQENAALGVVFLLNLLVYSYLILPVIARRLQDLGISGEFCRWAFYALSLSIPCIALSILGLIKDHTGMTNFGFGAGLVVLAPSMFCVLRSPWELSFKKGEPGPNQYGPNPLEVTP